MFHSTMLPSRHVDRTLSVDINSFWRKGAELISRRLSSSPAPKQAKSEYHRFWLAEGSWTRLSLRSILELHKSSDTAKFPNFPISVQVKSPMGVSTAQGSLPDMLICCLDSQIRQQLVNLLSGARIPRAGCSPMTFSSVGTLSGEYENVVNLGVTPNIYLFIYVFSLWNQACIQISGVMS